MSFRVATVVRKAGRADLRDQGSVEECQRELICTGPMRTYSKCTTNPECITGIGYLVASAIEAGPREFEMTRRS